MAAKLFCGFAVWVFLSTAGNAATNCFDASIDRNTLPAASFLSGGVAQAYSKYPIVTAESPLVRRMGAANPCLEVQTFTTEVAKTNVRVAVRRVIPSVVVDVANVPPNLPDPAKFIVSRVQEIRAQNPRAIVHVRFPPAMVWNFKSVTSNAHLTFDSVNDAVLDFNGSELVFHQAVNAIKVENSRNLAIRNLRMRHLFPSSILGVMESNSAGVPRVRVNDAQRARVEDAVLRAGIDHIGDVIASYTKNPDGSIKLGAKYSVESYGFKLQGLKFETDVDFATGKKTSWLSCDTSLPGVTPDLCRQIIRQKNGEPVAVILFKNNGSGFSISKVQDLTIEGIQARDVAGCFLFGRDRVAGVRLDNVQVTPSPEEMLGANACGLNIRGEDWIVRNSRFIGLGDDGINFHQDNWDMVFNADADPITISSNTIKSAKAALIGGVGDPFFVLNHEMVPIKMGRIRSFVQKADSVLIFADWVASAPRAQDYTGKSTIFFNANTMANRGWFERVVVGRTRARGIILSSNNTIVKDSKFYANHRSGLMVHQESNYFYSGVGSVGVTIQNNQFSANNYFLPPAPAKWWVIGDISVVTEPDSGFVPDPFLDTKVFQDILITGNTFEGSAGIPIQITSTSGARVYANTFTSFSAHPASYGFGSSLPTKLVGSPIGQAKTLNVSLK